MCTSTTDVVDDGEYIMITTITMESISNVETKKTYEQHRRMLMHGLTTGLPSIKNYVYCPCRDVWYRRNSVVVKTELESGKWFIKDGMLIKYTVYMHKSTETNDDNTDIDTEVVHRFTSIADIMRIVFRLACTDTRTYACLRTASKQFKNLIDGFGESILTNLVRKCVESKYYSFRFAPPMVIRVFCINHPYWMTRFCFRRETDRLSKMFGEFCKTELTRKDKITIIVNFFTSVATDQRRKSIYNAQIDTLLSLCDLRELISSCHLDTDQQIVIRTIDDNAKPVVTRTTLHEYLHM